MKNFVISLLLGLIVGSGLTWYFLEGRKTPQAQQFEQKITRQTEQVMGTVRAKAEAWRLRPKDIHEELSQTGKVVRRQVQDWGDAVADATADARITGAIKAKLLADRELSAWDISVSTADGVVTLAGNVSSHDHIGKAMMIALEVEGVKEVHSTLQVK